MDLNNLDMGSALLISVGGFITVFFILCIIIVLINFSAKLINKDQETNKLNKHAETTKNNEEQLVAVISAAVACSLNTTTDKIIIRDIKKVNKNKSAWLQAH